MLTSPFRAVYNLYQRSGWIIRGVLGILIIPFVLAYAGVHLAHAVDPRL